MSQEIVNGSYASAAWLNTVGKILSEGAKAQPRGRFTLELPHHTTRTHLSYPVVACPGRKLSYGFAAAEALWVLRGDNRVAPLAKHAPSIGRFSDDGETLTGAYGPRFVEQVAYVVETLSGDPATRQAALTFWKPSPAPSKDIPCTLALDFKLRGGRLHCHAYMRSSDAWLGLPYDIFTFSMIAAQVACLYNVRQTHELSRVDLGWLYLTASSSHLYQENLAAAAACVAEGHAPRGEPVPGAWIREGAWGDFSIALINADEGQEHTGQLWRVTP